MGTAGSPYFFFETLLGNKFDELVKSHIPYVVHASTRPVLSEPSTLREPQGERLFPNVLSEVEGQAHGSRRTVFPNVLSEVEGQAHGSRLTAQGERLFPNVLSEVEGQAQASARPVLSEPFVPSRASGRTVVSECPERSRRTGSRLTAQGERLFRTGLSKGDADFLRDHQILYRHETVIP